MKFRLAEFEDQPWFPSILREGMTDYLRFFLTATNFYEPVTVVIKEALDHSGENTLLDLCSGAGGAISKVYENLVKARGNPDEIILSDKFPNTKAYAYLKEKSKGRINFIAYPIDATAVPKTTKGLRVMFSAFHHFNRDQAKRVLENAVHSGRSIAIFDGGDKNLLTILGIIIFHPIAFLLLTPFFTPFRFSRLVFTYLIPLIPFCTVWDGVVSIARLYRPQDLLAMATEISAPNYLWKAGKLKNKLGMNVAYLVGYPV
jgi:hypothetical protein